MIKVTTLFKTILQKTRQYFRKWKKPKLNSSTLTLHVCVFSNEEIWVMRAWIVHNNHRATYYERALHFRLGCVSILDILIRPECCTTLSGLGAKDLGFCFRIENMLYETCPKIKVIIVMRSRNRASLHILSSIYSLISDVIAPFVSRRLCKKKVNYFMLSYLK